MSILNWYKFYYPHPSHAPFPIISPLLACSHLQYPRTYKSRVRTRRAIKLVQLLSATLPHAPVSIILPLTACSHLKHPRAYEGHASVPGERSNRYRFWWPLSHMRRFQLFHPCWLVVHLQYPRTYLSHESQPGERSNKLSPDQSLALFQNTQQRKQFLFVIVSFFHYLSISCAVFLFSFFSF